MLLPSGSSCKPRSPPECCSSRAGRPPEDLAGSTCSKWMERGSSAPAPPGFLLPINDPNLSCPGTSPSTPSSPHPSLHNPQALSVLPLSPPQILLFSFPAAPGSGSHSPSSGLQQPPNWSSQPPFSASSTAARAIFPKHQCDHVTLQLQTFGWFPWSSDQAPLKVVLQALVLPNSPFCPMGADFHSDAQWASGCPLTLKNIEI